MDKNARPLMQCNPAQLSVLSYANHFTLWHYKTAFHAIECPGYFDNVADILRENDMIIATTNTQDTPQTDFYTVLAYTKEHIVISRMNFNGAEGESISLPYCEQHNGSYKNVSFTEIDSKSLH